MAILDLIAALGDKAARAGNLRRFLLRCNMKNLARVTFSRCPDSGLAGRYWRRRPDFGINRGKE